MNTASGFSRVKREDIAQGLRSLGVRTGDNIFVHSSLSAFGWVDGNAEAVCDALLDAVGPGGTAAVPTFTWHLYHDQEQVIFDVRRDPTDNGAIPECFRRFPNARRSDHVCHSIAANGPRAEALMGDGVHPFSEGSSMHQLYAHDCWCLLLGCGFHACTALHIAEELAHVPYRYYRHFRGSSVIRADGHIVPSRALAFLLYRPYHNDFQRMEQVFAQAGLLRTVRIGAARAHCIKIRAVVDLALELLQGDIGALLCDASRRYLADAPPGFSR